MDSPCRGPAPAQKATELNAAAVSGSASKQQSQAEGDRLALQSVTKRAVITSFCACACMYPAHGVIGKYQALCSLWISVCAASC